MRYKVLTVDDSKTVRIIVKKAFKTYDCEILEAANGVEGLAAASKQNPDVILLDITMPVMDGVEMLTTLKSDPATKGIPIVMLTAEGGRDNVLKIATIGIRDYIVKPFKEDVLIENIGRIIDLKPLSDQPTKAKSIFDPANILVVEDKPAIIQQISEGLKHTPWQITGVNTTGEAIDFCGRTVPDMIVISLSLPEDSAYTLFRLLRTQVKTKYTPIFGLVVKTDLAAQNQAPQVVFTAIVTKPLDITELESKVAKAMNLDTSERDFSQDNGFCIMRLPEQTGTAAIHEVNTYLKPKISNAVDAGIARAIIDLHELKRLDMNVIKLLVDAMSTCRELGLQFSMVGSGPIVNECKGFEDTRNWIFHDTLAEAKSALDKPEPVSA
ncbi:MAG: response regulator [Candidatus Synoicihabitans palmerolidicus]|nr:response regulator [Candidatus Synoicihabitans palmerolidicus]